jgi:diacylglycerol kinase family enzyme
MTKVARLARPIDQAHRPDRQPDLQREVRLEASGIVIYADGERFAPPPISIEVVPAAVNVLVAGPDA